MNRNSKENHFEKFIKENNNQLAIKDDSISKTNHISLNKRNKKIIDDDDDNFHYSSENYRQNLNYDLDNSSIKINNNDEQKVDMMKIEKDNLMERFTPGFKQNKVFENSKFHLFRYF